MTLTDRRHELRQRLESEGTYRRWVLWTALAGMFATSFPITILSVSLPDIAGEFDASVSTLTWVISAPMFLSAVTVPVLGKMGDLYGHRRVFLIGFVAATVVSVATAAAWDPFSLIGLRSVAQVIGGATQPTSLALLMLVFPIEERVKATGWWSMVAAGAPAVGLAVGGPLVDLVGWRIIFLLQGGLAVGALAMALVILPESQPRRVRFDIAGSFWLLVSVGAAMLALGQGESWGWLSAPTVACLVTSVVGLRFFVGVERRAEAPLLPLEFLRRRNFTFTLATSLVQGAVYMGGFVLAPLTFRDLFGLTATATSAIMLLRTAVFSLSSPVGGRVGVRYGPRTMALVGTGLLTLAMVVFTFGASQSMLAIFAVGLVSQGLGFGLGRPSVTAALANSVPEGDLGIASALQRMVMQIGNSFGITVLSMLYDDSGTAAGFALPFAVGIGLGAVAMFLAGFIIPDRSSDTEREEPELVVSASSVGG